MSCANNTPSIAAVGVGRKPRVAFTALGAQAIPDRPGGTRPAQLEAPRIPPLAQAEWTDAHRQLAAKYARDGRRGQRSQDASARAGDGGRLDAFQRLHLERVQPVTSSPRAPDPSHRLAVRKPVCLVESCGGREDSGLTAGEIRRVAQGADAQGWEPFEATLLRMADELYRNSAVSDTTWKALSARYDMYHLMDAVMTVADFTTLSIMYNSMGVRPDEGVPDRLPTDIPYRVVVPEREPPLTVARVEPLEGSGIAITRTFARYPKLAEPRARNSNYVNRGSKLLPRYREMLILRTGWNCRSEYEWAQHVGSVGRARDYGLDPVRIAEGPTAPGWDPFEVGASTSRRRAVSRRDDLRPHVDDAGRALRHHHDDERDRHREQLPDGLHGAQRAGRPDRTGQREIPEH